MSPALSKAQLAISEVRSSFLAAAVGARASRSATTSAFRARRACVSRVDDPTARACRSGLGSHETKPSLGRSRADAAVSRAATGTDDGAGRVGVRRMLSSGRGVGKCARARLWSTVSPRGTDMRINIKIFLPKYLSIVCDWIPIRTKLFFFFLINKAFSGEEPAVDASRHRRASPTMPTREKDFPVEFVFGWSR
jgi:hypothetical protein